MDVPIKSTYRYRVLRIDEKTQKVYTTTCYQELVVVKDLEGRMGYKVVLFIPDREYSIKNPGDVSRRLTNGIDMGDYSGLKIYTDIEGRMTRVNRFLNGKKTVGIDLTTPGTFNERLALYVRALKTIGKISIQRQGSKAVMSRGEDDWYDDSWEDMWGSWWGDEYDDESDVSNDYYEKVDVLPGEDVYYNNYDGNYYIDFDGDGHVDSCISSESIITPPDEGSQTTPPDDPIEDPVEPIEPVEPGGGTSGGNSSAGNGGSGDSGDSGDVSKITIANKLFRNSNMTPTNWQVIEKMLGKIIENCMGNALVNGLIDALDGLTLSIQFSNGSGAGFHFDGQSAGITLGMNSVESNVLFHEMWHAYQAYQETQSSFNGSLLNQEIEAHYAQYLYLISLPEYDGSKWEEKYINVERLRGTAGIKDYVDNKGTLIGNYDLFDTYINATLVPVFQSTDGYENYQYDSNRNAITNFSNIQTLTIDC